MTRARWMKGLLVLVLLHLPVVAAALYYARSPSVSVRAPAGPLLADAPLAPAPALLPVAFPVPAPLPPPAPAREREAAVPGGGAAGAALPTPMQQGAARKEFIEGHWLGLEVIPLVPELAREYGIAEDESGILVDEITLEAAESGILAGDLVHSIEGQPTPDLRAFFQATQTVRRRGEATVQVLRRGRPISYTLRARNAPELGMAQMEAAQPILPGSISPHRTRSRPCTDCHVIMATGGQLPTDAGDITPTPPRIPQGATAPHRYRGPCISCHRILP